MVAVMPEKTKISERHACLLAGLSRTVLHYQGNAKPENEQLLSRMVELAGEHRSVGSKASPQAAWCCNRVRASGTAKPAQ